MSTRLLWQMCVIYLLVMYLFETVVCNGDNDVVINSICDGLFETNCKLYVEDEFDAHNVLIYKPPLLRKVWLNEAGCCQGKEDLLRQRLRNEDLMHARRQETCERADPTPFLPAPITDDVPDGTAISDDDSVDSSVYSQLSEPKSCWSRHH